MPSSRNAIDTATAGQPLTPLSNHVEDFPQPKDERDHKRPTPNSNRKNKFA